MKKFETFNVFDMTLPNGKRIQLNFEGKILFSDSESFLDVTTLYPTKQFQMLILHYCPELAPSDVIIYHKYDYDTKMYLTDMWFAPDDYGCRIAKFKLEIPATELAQERLENARFEWLELS